MKKPASALVAALLLSAGVAYAGEVAKTATAKPAEKPAAEAVKPAETAAPNAHAAKVHHKKSHAHKAMAGDGSVKPTDAKAATTPAGQKAPEAPKQ